MKPSRIEFPLDDPARFNALRDQWRDVAASYDLPKVAHRVASLLPGFVSREFGYAFPTDEQLAETIKVEPRTIGRGMKSLDNAGLIERQTMVKRDAKGEAIGRLRRIYLTLPKQAGERTTSERTEVNGHTDVNGQKQAGERTDVCPNILDSNTPDKKTRNENKVSTYVPTREGYPVGYEGDDDFLNAFDQNIMSMTDGKVIGAGEIERIIEEAFDRTTKSSDLFMPFYWRDVCALREPDTQNWFRQRTGRLIHRRAA